MASTSRFEFDVLSNLPTSHIPPPLTTGWVHHDSTKKWQARARLDVAAIRKLPFILTVLLKSREYDRELEYQLLEAFPDFPTRLLRRLYEPTTDGQGSVVLPSLSDSESLTFLANYPRIETPTAGSSGHGERDDTRPGHTPVQFVPALCWCSSVDYHTRLARFEQWAFLDLAVVLSDWPVIWANARRELADLHNSMYSTSNAAIADLSTTRIIHQDMATIISLREELRLFIAAYAKVRQILRRVFPGDTDTHRVQNLWKMTSSSLHHTLGQNGEPSVTKEAKITQLEKWLDELENRLEDSETNLEHQLETSEVILRQLENLLDLTFSTQAIAQGQSMATLNLMATVFLPLSFVASVFGMTEFNISAAWYPLAAFVVLCLVAAALFRLSPVPLPAGSARSQPSGKQPTFHILLSLTGKSPRFWKAKPSPSNAGTPVSSTGSTTLLADDKTINTALSLLSVANTVMTPQTPVQPREVARPGLLSRIFRLPTTRRHHNMPAQPDPPVAFTYYQPAHLVPPPPHGLNISELQLPPTVTPVWHPITGGEVGSTNTTSAAPPRQPPPRPGNTRSVQESEENDSDGLKIYAPAPRRRGV